MKSFLCTGAVVVGVTAATFVACGGKDQNVVYPAQPQSMNQLTPAEQAEAKKRAGQDDERERQLAASREPQPGSGAPTVTGTTTALALSAIGTARCDRELKCKNIGVNKTYLSTDECITKMQNDKRTALNEYECPKGVSDKELASCLKFIREEACGNPFETIMRQSNCRSSTLCLK